MAEEMLFAVAQNIIEDLGSQAFQGIVSLWDVKAELRNIKDTVSTIQAVLRDAAKQPSHSDQVKDWLEKLKEAVYEADDLLGEFKPEDLQQGRMNENIAKKVRNFFSSSNPIFLRWEMSRRITEMKQKLNAIAEDKNLYLKEYHVSPVSVERDETHSFMPDEIVIGREDDKKAIIELLLEPSNEENVSIVPIVGIGGLGKTTLAQFVYNDKNIQEHFELKMWICISDVFDVKVIIQTLILAARKDPVGQSMDMLQDQLRNIINQKKYLLVLDDVWNEDPHKWERLKVLLVGGAKGSKIVITTRARLVAEIACPALIYTLKGLNDGQSWLLFKQIAFRKGQGQGTNNPRLEEIGLEIVHKCQGVPLAIKSIGNVLRLEKTEHKWSYVNNNILEIATQQKNDIFPILKLSYDHLPFHLKSCFAFCSIFPKDYEIDKVILKQLWIGQGFIRPSNKNQELEDVADEYFKDLLWRSFFEEVTVYGKLKYKMHDLIHDLAQLVAGAECAIITLDQNNFDEKTRHVSLPFYIDSSFIETSSLLVRAEMLRTCLLTFIANEPDKAGKLDESKLNKLFLSFRKLRVLGLCGVHIERVPDSIEKLIHLTYLDFSWNRGIVTLPNAISRLWKLQTLKVNGCLYLKELPRDIRFLVGLRHLENSRCLSLSHMPDGLGQMTRLQTLSLYVVRDNQASTSGPISNGLDLLNSLNSLRGELQISNLRCLEDVYSEPIAANLRAKQYLDRLTLSWYNVGHLYGFNGDDGDSDGDSDGDDGDNDGDDGDSDGDNDGNDGDSDGDDGDNDGDDGDNDGDSDGNDGGDGDDKLLDGLEPHQNLKYLSVEWYGGVRFSSWLSLLTNLVDLSIYNCKRCQQLPRLSQLHSLERLLLCKMEVLEYISDGDINEEVPTSSFFPSLKSISIWGCPNLKGWWRSTSTTVHQQHPHHQSLPSFHHLSMLDISSCPNLTSLPPFPYLEESLDLSSVSLKSLQPTIAMTSSLPSSSSFLSSPFSKLKSMSLWSITDTEALPDEWMSNLSSLKQLKLRRCPQLQYLSLAIPHLTSLESLEIMDCELFDSISDMGDDGIEWQHLKCLSFLRYYGVPNLKSIPSGLQHVTALRKLVISDCPNLTSFPKLTSVVYLEISSCPNLTSIPDLISNLTSLEELSISNCPNLKSLPDEMVSLNSLQKLTFKHCPDLGISNCPNLTIFPTLTSVVYLEISVCPNLTSIPHGISNLTSLEELLISYCENLISLPDEMVSLKSLRKLTISYCPDLAKRCEKGIGEDWFKIAHVPVIEIRNW